MWDRKPSSDPAPFISAIDAYDVSNTHESVTQLVDIVFKENAGQLVREAAKMDVEAQKKSAFATRLVQIALDNRLRKLNRIFEFKYYQPH